MPEQGTKPRRAIVITKDEDGQSSRIQNGGLSEPNSKENGTDGGSGKVDEVHLMDLLKQTSQATSTSSEHLVNTTTTTAVQPLHIDANTLLVERNETTGNQQRHDGTSSKSSVSPASRDESLALTHNVGQKSMPLENQSSQSTNPGNDRKDSPVGAEGGVRGHSKNSSLQGQAARNVARMNGDGSVHQRSYNQSSANQRPGRNDHNARGVRPSDARPPEGSEMTSMTSAEVNSGSVGGKVAAGGREVPTTKSEPRMARAAVEDEARTDAEATTMNSTTTMSNNTATMTMTTTKSNNHASSAVGAVNASANASGSAARTRNANRGSDASLKSSTGVSTDSIESVRSTDTGVSLNTVRGVSSPREKTGVHVVKRQEIETLSGNIVHVEQNGEPA